MICANRTDDPAFFTPCAKFGGVCACGEELRAEVEAEKAAQACVTGPRSAEQVGNAANDIREICGPQIAAQSLGSRQ